MYNVKFSQTGLFTMALLFLAACGAGSTTTKTSIAEPSTSPLPPSPTVMPSPSPTAQPTVTALPPTPTSSTSGSAEAFANVLAYGLPGMEQVEVQTVEYRRVDDAPHFMDIYYPPQTADDQQLPVVIFVMGFADEAAMRLVGSPLKDFDQYTSWGRLVASAGLIGVTYETERSDDLDHLVDFIHQNAEGLNIDADRVGLWSSSANALTAISYAMQEDHSFLSFAVFYYGSMLTPDGFGLVESSNACQNLGCYSPSPENGPDGLPEVAQIRVDLPLLIIRAGKDDTPGTNISTDHFVEQATAVGAQLTVLEHPEAVHSFDILQDDDRSVEIIIETLEFMTASFARP